MRRRRRDEAVVRRTRQRVAQARRGRPEQPPATQQTKKERKHPDMLTVAIRGGLAQKFRQIAEATHLSLGRLLQDAILVYEGQLKAGYEAGTSFAGWKEAAAGR